MGLDYRSHRDGLDGLSLKWSLQLEFVVMLLLLVSRCSCIQHFEECFGSVHSLYCTR